ncbi:uncharacterized protein CCOS01_09233 [Colletotrichum costaricense]|uniref:Uncharacterized protein n=1 Tax=Colletotrichum costaricense TaxID=1209916 RepID=A0AAJ0DZX3_9PEZI|nr:uncharacterized protein CCOS01_09233 [Colletotrichum costaricense]KAK1524146.1 hypothetical protein CCOS01_09233 [Colletotrichum costaricense]
MQRKGACSNITDANFIAILQQGIGYQVYRETVGNGPCTHKYLWIHSQVEVLCPRLRLCPRDSCMCEPHCPKPQAKVFPFFFFFSFTPQPRACSCCLLALLARCLLSYTVLRPHLGLAGPTKAPSALRLMQLQTSNSYFVSPTASLEHGGGSPSPSNLTPPLPETVTVCILFLPPSRRPRFGCPSHCQFSSLWAACRTQQLT